MSFLKIKNLSVDYQMRKETIYAAKNLNIDINKGEILGLVGESGSGKSTAMNLIGCLDIPSKGSVYLSGQDISKLEESDLAQIRGKKIGFIFQQFNLINTLSALENVMLPMMFQDVPEAIRRARAEKLLKMVDLGERMHHKPKELSGGQQQRVAIARSLSVDPDVILGDEPTGNLDSKTGITVMDFLKKLNKEEGKTIIMVTHDDVLAKQAQKITYLKDGKVVTKSEIKRM